jgi:hypothetical protein
MTSAYLKRLKVIGCLPLQEGKSGFAVPLFAHPTEPSLRLIQEIDELRDIIEGFRIVESDVSGEIAISGPEADVGGDILYGFLTGDGNVHVGTLAELSPLLKGHVTSNPTQIAVVLQIQELIGATHEKKSARFKMRQLVLKQSGTSAARAFYEGSVLRTALWQNLLTLAPNEGVARRVLAARGAVSAAINFDGTINLDLSALDVHDRALFSEKQIINLLMAEIVTTEDSAELLDAGKAESRDVKVAADVAQLLRKIKTTGRQEERLAILIDAILRDRETGIRALLHYKDRAKFATWALHELRNKLSTSGYNENKVFFDSAQSPTDELLIAEIIPRLFTHYYPLSRGNLLYFLAKHLAKWPMVNTAISNTLKRTQSVFAHSRGKEIEQILAEGAYPQK